MTHESEPALPTLHAVRLLGYADVSAAAARFGQGVGEVEEALLDAEAFGWVRRSSFAGRSGWSLTERGKAENERRLGEEVDRLGARVELGERYRRFLVLNATVQEAVTRWQIRPLPGAPLQANDHTDHRWDDRVLDTLASAGRQLGGLEPSELLGRFSGYAARFRRALDRALGGQHDAVDGVGQDSCHTVWMQLHEDFLATLGLER